MRKYVLLTIAVLAVIAGILGFFFSSPKYQIGDNIIEGKYLDTKNRKNGKRYFLKEKYKLWAFGD